MKFRNCSNRILLIGLPFLIYGCLDTEQPSPDHASNRQEDHLFALISSSHTNVHFNNKITENYHNFFFDFNYAYNGGGVAIGDINSDGLPDMYFSGNQVPNKLYLNKGDFVFEDITISAGVSGGEGWHNGVVMADVNADGLLDIYVCKGGFRDKEHQRKNTLYINQGDVTFKEQAATYNLDDAGYSTMASFFDMDNDNDLDMYLVNRPEVFHLGYELVLQGKKEGHALYRDKLYRNDDGQFTDVGLQSGIVDNFGYGLGLVTSDLNSDGFSDVFVANDYYENDYLYINNGNGQFTESIKKATNHIPFYAMGVDVVDINNDGLEDIIELDMSSEDYERSKTTMASMDIQLFNDLRENGFHKQYMHNMLHLNQGKGFFSDIGQLAGIAQTDWSWSCLGSDFDNDGYRDIFISNGFLRDIWDKDTNEKVKRYIASPVFRSKPRQESAAYIISLYKPNKRPNYIYQNDGDLTFTDKTAEWGLTKDSFSNGAATGDLDNDGDLDLVVNNINGEAFIYRNESERLDNHYLKIKLNGPAANPNGVGAKITISTKKGIQFHEFKTVRGYLSSVEPIIHFGLGENKEVDKVQVVWTDGFGHTVERVPANQTLILNYQESIQTIPVALQEQPVMFEATNEVFESVFIHQEDEYDDFKDQILLPHKLSQNGPGLAVADINGDSLEDFFIGGGKGQSGKIYTQMVGGSFKDHKSAILGSDAEYEDVGAAFFDIDQDGDQDLYVVSGGNEVVDYPHYYQDRLYINDGRGVFAKSNLLPDIHNSGSCVVPGDYDNDGDIDLFIGGRVSPGKYPQSPRSFLLRNDHGQLVDATDQTAPGLRNIGMVTSAIWADLNSDGSEELILAGEWMPITIFEKEGEVFVDQTSDHDLSKTVGWWNKIVPADLDHDGDIDLIAGNLGLNYKFRASQEKPFIVYAGDFDMNGTNDIFLAKHYQDRIVPIRGKECASQQLPVISQKFPTYRAFAQANINQILGDNIQDATKYQAYLFETVVLENRQGKMNIKSLPVQAQFSTANGIVVHDFNTDGIQDVLIAGNKFEVEVETTPADSSPGFLLLGSTDGNYQALNPTESGFFASENVKDVKMIRTNANSQVGILVAVNDGKLKYFKTTVP